MFLKQRQLEILLLLSKFRFLDRRQIQTLLKHKHHRSIIAWLSDMTKKNIVGKLYSRKRTQINNPAVYYLDKKAIKYLKGRKDINPKLLGRLYREKVRSTKFVSRCLLLADAYLLFRTAETRKTKLHFFTKTNLEGLDYLPEPLPDAYIALQKSKKNTKRYFLDIFDENGQRFLLRKRVKQYIEYADGEEWEDGTGHPFPSILFICPDESSKKYLAKFISKELEEKITDISFYITSKDRINSRRKRKIIWNTVKVL